MKQKIIPFLKLIRLPNLFTAASNTAAAAFISMNNPVFLNNNTGKEHLNPKVFIAVIGASVLLYGAGIIFNDYFDYETDKAERPGRPLPSGQISRMTALGIACFLLAAGVFCAFNAGMITGLISVVLGMMILLYDSLLKQRLIPGALGMGLCRGLNWLMGLSVAPGFTGFILYPVIITIYIALLTGAARQEVKKPVLKKAVILGLTAVPVIDGIILLIHQHYTAAIIVAALIIPVQLLRKKFYMT